MASSGTVQAPVEWAQRKDVVFLTIAVDDCKQPLIELSDDRLHFSGKAGPDQRQFECTLDFYAAVDSAKARRTPSNRNIEYVIPKKESGPFWPRLMKAEGKVHWIKVDFNRWKDEDDLSDDEGGKMDFADMMGQMGDFGGGKPDLDDLGDSDNEELPDLEDGEEREEREIGEKKNDGDGTAASTV